MDNQDALAMLDYQREFNKAATNWGRSTRSRFLMELRNQNFAPRQVKDNEQILRLGTGMKARKQQGDVVRLTFPFARHGIFQEIGVGRGRRKGSGKEVSKPWIEPTFNATMPMLAEQLAQPGIRALGKIIQIKVNGIFEISL
jgi:hypothetical protein